MKYRYELNLREPCDWKGVENHLQKMAAGGIVSPTLSGATAGMPPPRSATPWLTCPP